MSQPLRALAMLTSASLACLALTSCGADTVEPAQSPTPSTEFRLTSPDVDADGVVPTTAIGSFGSYCDGENRSPALAWTDAPAGTVSFTVLMVDASYPHWAVMNIPATATGLPSAENGEVTEGIVGTSIAGPGGYVGPCVEGHSYVYTVYALDIELEATEATTVFDAEGLMQGHILAEASLTTRRE
jgi:Raf kinase inhibitor-like YbhB/YbcL family protein